MNIIVLILVIFHYICRELISMITELHTILCDCKHLLLLSSVLLFVFIDFKYYLFLLYVSRLESFDRTQFRFDELIKYLQQCVNRCFSLDE